MSKPRKHNEAEPKKRSRGASQVVGGALVLTLLACANARADQVVSCGGFAMLGGAQINCSHMVPKAPTQFCTFSWSLMTVGGAPDIIEGSFLLPPGASNAMVYQAGGFNSALSNPIILCQGKKSR